MRMQADAGVRLAVSARPVEVRLTSESRVVITPMPCAESIERSRAARLSVTSFSRMLSLMRAPVSPPPCAASRTTRNRGVTLGGGGAGTEGAGWVGRAGAGGGACCDCPGPKRSSGSSERFTQPRPGELIQRINRETAEKFGEEVGGLLRQHLAGKGDFPELIERDRIHQESRTGFAASHLFDGLCGVADISHMRLLADRLGRNPQQPLQHQSVKLNYVELPLPLGDIAQGLSS